MIGPDLPSGVRRPGRAVSLPSPELQRMGFDFDEFDAEIAAALEGESAAVDPITAAVEGLFGSPGGGMAPASSYEAGGAYNIVEGDYAEGGRLGGEVGSPNFLRRIRAEIDAVMTDAATRVVVGERLVAFDPRVMEYLTDPSVAQEVIAGVVDRVAAPGTLRHSGEREELEALVARELEGFLARGGYADRFHPVREYLESRAAPLQPMPGATVVGLDPAADPAGRDLAGLTDRQLEAEVRNLQGELGATSMQEGIEATSQRPALARLEALQAEWARRDEYNPAIDTLDYYRDNVLPSLDEFGLAEEIADLEAWIGHAPASADDDVLWGSEGREGAEDRLEVAREEAYQRGLRPMPRDSRGNLSPPPAHAPDWFGMSGLSSADRALLEGPQGVPISPSPVPGLSGVPAAGPRLPGLSGVPATPPIRPQIESFPIPAMQGPQIHTAGQGLTADEAFQMHHAMSGRINPNQGELPGTGGPREQLEETRRKVPRRTREEQAAYEKALRERGRGGPAPVVPPPQPPPVSPMEDRNPELRSMDSQMLTDMMAAQATQPDQGYFGGMGEAIQGLTNRVAGMSNMERAALISALVAAGLITMGSGGMLAPAGAALVGGAGMAALNQ